MPDIPEGLPTIGKATLALLRSKGVKDAWSIVMRGTDGHDGIPGLGPAKWAVLYEWAQSALTLDERQRLLASARDAWKDLTEACQDKGNFILVPIQLQALGLGGSNDSDENWRMRLFVKWMQAHSRIEGAWLLQAPGTDAEVSEFRDACHEYLKERSEWEEAAHVETAAQIEAEEAATEAARVASEEAQKRFNIGCLVVCVLVGGATCAGIANLFGAGLP